jgi:hypothetical protein
VPDDTRREAPALRRHDVRVRPIAHKCTDDPSGGDTRGIMGEIIDPPYDHAAVPTGAIGVIKSIGLTLSGREGLTPSSGLTNPYFVPFPF